MRLPDHSLHSPYQQPQIMSSRVVEIAKAAEDLSLKLAATVSELQTRKQESNHVHGLLITRCEKAAQRIIALDQCISEMQDDFEANQSELRFLRIQLQAIEAQSSQYILRDEDEELSKSIMKWKGDWEDIDRRSRARRRRGHVSITSLDDSHISVDSA